jgi:signal peptidase I
MPLQPQTVVDANHRQKIQLFIQALRSYGCASLRVTGTSMWPALWPGDTVEIRTEQIAEIKIGDLAAFTRDDRIFIHRVIRNTMNGAATLVTRGDALPVEDPPVRESELLGIATVSERVPRTFLSRLRQSVRYRLLPPMRYRIRS